MSSLIFIETSGVVSFYDIGENPNVYIQGLQTYNSHTH